MKSHVFLTPSAPGKPGQVVELEFDDQPVEYLEPLPYWSANDAALDGLKQKVAQAETDLRHARARGASATELLRYESALTSLKQELDQALTPRRRQRQREGGIGRDDAPPARQSLAEMVASVTAGVAAFLKKSPLACNASPRCVAGPGRYKCARCRAKAAAAA